MELIFNPYGEFQLSLEGPVSQIHSPHFHDGTPGIFSDLLRSVQTLKRSGVQKATGRYCIYSSLVKLQPCSWVRGWRPAFWQNATLVPELSVKNLPLCRTLWWWWWWWYYILFLIPMLYFKLFYMLLVISIIVYYSLTAIQEVPGLIPSYTLEIFLEV